MRCNRAASALLGALLALSACGSRQERERYRIAGIYAIGAFGTGLSITAQQCAQANGSVCRDTVVYSAASIIGSALAAFSAAYLSADNRE